MFLARLRPRADPGLRVVATDQKVARFAKLTVVLLASVLSVVAIALAGCQRPAPTPTAESAAPREPGRLEVRLPIEMGDMFFATGNGAKSELFRVPSGKVVGMRVANRGALEHEIAFGQAVTYQEGRATSYGRPLFSDLPVDVFVYPSGKKVEVETEGGVEAIEMEPGSELWLRMTFPPEARGEWEIGCFIPGHYEAGMKARLIIE